MNPWNITDLAAAIEHSLTMRCAHELGFRVKALGFLASVLLSAGLLFHAISVVLSEEHYLAAREPVVDDS